MGLRFRKSVKLAPGVRLNFSGSGTSLTLGPRGASFSFGSRGTFFNAGVPGTGLSSRTHIGASGRGSSSSRRAPQLAALPPATATLAARVVISDDGTVEFKDADGHPLSDYLVGLAKRQQGEKIRETLNDVCERLNEETESLGLLHCHTPQPISTGAAYRQRTFPHDVPAEPNYRKPTLLDWVLLRRARILRDNEQTKNAYDAEIAKWNRLVAAFRQREEQRAAVHAQRLRDADVEFMQEILERELSEVTWPRETLISFDIDATGRRVALDVDLPEIEDLKRKLASVPSRGYKLTLKEMSQKAHYAFYSKHVHSIAFRIIGEVFASLPTVNSVTLSGYKQRSNPRTGHTQDDYVFSVRVTRESWTKLNCFNLQALDIEAVFEQFELRRKALKSGALAIVEPFTDKDARRDTE